MELINGILQAEDDGLILEIMVKYPPYYKSSDRAKWPRINGRLGVGGSGSGVSSLAFSDFTSSFTGINRTVIDANGLMKTLPASVVAIDHVGPSLTPMLRLEPAGTNLLFGTRTFTGAAGWTLDSTVVTTKDQTGIFGDANGATTGSDGHAGAVRGVYRSIAKSASDSTTFFKSTAHFKKTIGAVTFPGLTTEFVGVDSKGASYAVNTNTGVITANSANNAANIGGAIKDVGWGWKVDVWATDNAANTSAQIHIYFAVNADASAVWVSATVGSCVIDAAMLTTGSIPSSYFAGAAAIGAELVTGTDSTFAGAGNWVGTTLGTFNVNTTLAGRAYMLGNADNDYMLIASKLTVGKCYRATLKAELDPLDAGGMAPTTIRAGSVAGTRDGYFEFTPTGTEATFVGYFIAEGTSFTIGLPSSGFTGIAFGIDDVSVKEHGTVRLSEANTVTTPMPAAVAAMLAAGTGTIVIKGRFAFARAAGIVTAILSAQDATASLAYTTTTAGNLTAFDETTVAENTGAYTANVDWKIAITFPSSAGKYRIGVDANGAGIVQGTEAAFDGDFTTGANLILGRVLHGATWIKWIKFFDNVLTSAEINSLT